MATAVSISFYLDSQSCHNHDGYRRCNHDQQQHHLFLKDSTTIKPKKLYFLSPSHSHPFLIFPKSERCHLTLSFSTSPSSSSSTSSSPIVTLRDPLYSGRFLTNRELEKLQFLENFKYDQELGSGSMSVRVMRQEEMEIIVRLLVESFAESMFLPVGSETLLGFLVRQYVVERRTLMPHTATLVAFYRDDGEEDEMLAGTVEVSFDKKGLSASLPTPTPPKNSPYICNMIVKKPLRRKGIGWHLLKACEELISQMSSSSEVYLHCRLIDQAPFNMYTRAGYRIMKSDNFLIIFLLQRRKHLMCKKLQQFFNNPLETDDFDSNNEMPSS